MIFVSCKNYMFFLWGKIVCICGLTEVRKSQKRLDPQIANPHKGPHLGKFRKSNYFCEFADLRIAELICERPPLVVTVIQLTQQFVWGLNFFQGLFSKKVYDVEYNPRTKHIKWYLLMDSAAFVRYCVVTLSPAKDLCVQTAFFFWGGGWGCIGGPGDFYAYSLCDIWVRPYPDMNLCKNPPTNKRKRTWDGKRGASICRSNAANSSFAG